MAQLKQSTTIGDKNVYDELVNANEKIDENHDEIVSHKAENIHIGNNASVKIFSTSDQTISNAEQIILNRFDTVLFDTKDMFDESEPDKLRCKEDGIYLMTIQVHWEENSSGYRMIQIIRNDTSIASDRVLAATSDTVRSIVQNVSTAYELSNGDIIQVRVWQDSGSTLEVMGGGNSYISPVFSAINIG